MTTDDLLLLIGKLYVEIAVLRARMPQPTPPTEERPPVPRDAEVPT